MLSPYRTVILLVLSCLSVCLAVTLVYCGQTAGWIKMKPGVEIGLGPGHIVLNGDPSPLPKGGTAAPHFRLMYSGETAGWIKMPLGMEVGLSSGDTVLDGDPAPPKGGTAPAPVFQPCLLWPNGWMDQDAA